MKTDPVRNDCSICAICTKTDNAANILSMDKIEEKKRLTYKAVQ